VIGDDIASTVRVEWSPLREEAAWAGVAPRRRRRIVRRAALACAVVAAVALVLVPRSSPAPAPVAVVPPAPVAPRASATPAPPPVAVAAPSKPLAPISIELARGTRRFTAAGRRTEVRSGRVTVVAYDAEFACAHEEHATHVEVFRGSVLVRAPDGEHALAAGEHFELAEPVPERAEDLLNAADVMRMSHHPEQAVPLLQRIVRDHAADPRAPLAAFTLGRVLLDELDRPRDAAAAFADSLRLAPDGPLAEDALAREIEAATRAGDATSARSLAEDYIQRFPHGLKSREVRRLGGIE
jgi:hypothetical protein